MNDDNRDGAFLSPASQGFARIACVAPRVRLGQPHANAREHARIIGELASQTPDAIVFPELSITGYSLDDLHMQDAMLEAAEDALLDLARDTGSSSSLIVAGAPMRHQDAIFNCAVVMCGGEILGLIPKSYLPNYREYYERRQFAPAHRSSRDTIRLGTEVPFSTDLIFRHASRHDLTIAIEICEDLWAPIPPSTYAALGGARIILNLSASNVTIGKSRERARLCLAHSQRAACAYAYATAGPGESTTDLAWDGQLGIFELGQEIAKSPRYQWDSTALIRDVDLRAIEAERRRLPTFHDCRDTARKPVEVVFSGQGARAVNAPLRRDVARYPFIRDDASHLDEECGEAYAIQVEGLGQRLRATGIEQAVIGVSGGLDSCHALLVVADTFRRFDWPLENILAFSLTGFATGEESAERARTLCEALGVTHEVVDIRPMAQSMLEALDHPAARGEAAYDITYENVQAGLRTDFLFRAANARHALVIGTGDLSEAALGWSTYGVGDHMSHYGVNAGVPKTLIQQLIAWNARNGRQDAWTAAALEAILAAEITPELVPTREGGQAQSTEATIGPYALHDFFLHYAARWGFAPSRIAYLALHAWGDREAGRWPDHIAPVDRRSFSGEEIFDWLEVFLKRFYQTSQFKRSATPNAPKVTSAGALSPRGDWRAPSDVSAEVWLQELRQARSAWEASR
jgi:NAD+ synthase (glutamine-hydrolysing)